jgi:hypothetical protein
LSLAAVRKLKVRWSRLDRLDVMLGRPPRWRHHRLQRLDVVRLSERKALDRLRLAASGLAVSVDPRYTSLPTRTKAMTV